MNPLAHASRGLCAPSRLLRRICVALCFTLSLANAQSWYNSADLYRGTQWFTNGYGTLGISIRSSHGGGWAWQLIDAMPDVYGPYFTVNYPSGDVRLKGRLYFSDGTSINSRSDVGGGGTGNAFVGDVGHGLGYAGLSHQNCRSPLWYGFLQHESGTATFINARSGGAIFFRIENQDRMLMNSAGNLLINKTGQSNGNYKLDVNGMARVNDITVNTTGADFVFEDDYRLPTLAEVEAFVKAHKRLPGLAPASEMQKEGVAVGELQTRLLQKIEELTLYMIEQEKRIQKLEQENQKLKKIK